MKSLISATATKAAAFVSSATNQGGEVFKNDVAKVTMNGKEFYINKLEKN